MIYTHSTGDTGRGLALTLKRVSDGFTWNDVSEAWEAAPSFANASMNMLEFAGSWAGAYQIGPSASIGSPGHIVALIHDTAASDIVIANYEWLIVNNEAVTPTAIADTILKRSWASANASAIGDAGDRNLLGAVARLVNKTVIDTSTLVMTVYEADDSTVHTTAAVLATAGAAPITTIDPA